MGSGGFPVAPLDWAQNPKVASQVLARSRPLGVGRELVPPFQACACSDLIVRIGQRDAMRTIELIGDIDGQHRLHTRVPTEISAGQAPRVMVFLPEEDEAGRLWANGMASEWSADLADSSGRHLLAR